MSAGRAPSIHLWAPGFSSFGGGITAFNRELALAIAADRGVQLIGKLDSSGFWGGLPLWGAGRFKGPVRTTHFAFGLVAQTLRTRPSAIVCGHVNFGPVALALRRALQIPYALVAYGVEIGPHLPALKLRALKGAQEVWAISRWTRSRLLECGVAEETIRLVPVTFAEAGFTPGHKSPDLSARYSIAPEAKVILTVARLHSGERYKGCDRVLEALPAVRKVVGSVRYLVVGDGDDIPRLRRLAADCGAQQEVVFCGFVPESELADHYRLADAFAMPSTAEGFGIVFLEAMACGTPVLGGNRDGATDALSDGELGLVVDPESPDAIAQGLIALLRRKGPAFWYRPEDLRHQCLVRHGREAFRSSVREALQEVLARAGRH